MGEHRERVTITREISAGPAQVYDAWLDPKHLGGPWFGARNVILNPVVDGLFYHRFEHEGRPRPHYGRFVRLDRPRVIEYTWVSEGTRGVETTVRVTLEANGHGTIVTLQHLGLTDEVMEREHRDGWEFVLGALAVALTSANSESSGRS
jgi:uncharacterized protein YndB with AHSA1/START domain